MTKIDKAKRAFERRFGASLAVLTVREFTHENGGQCLRVFDPETGSWAEYNVSGWRIHRIREHDAMNQPTRNAGQMLAGLCRALEG